jgi:uncharacterized protein (TIGR03437 family)
MQVSSTGLMKSLLLATLVVAGAKAQTIQDFFDGRELHDIRLTMDPADWTLLHERYSDKKTNYRVIFEWRGIRLANTGIHTRGTGSLNPRKPGLAIEFAKYEGSQTFLGMPAIFLRNFVEDPSGMHERLAMQVFERMGLQYQRTAHARLFVNGKYEGLYQTLEPLDNRFLITRFGTAGGYLYEGIGGTDFHFQYLGDDPAAYVPDLLEPKNHSGNEAVEAAQRIAAMVRAVNQAPDAEFATQAGEFLDLDAVAAYTAVETAIAECDGFLSPSGMANYYLYRRPGDNRFSFIVWDKEMTFVSSTAPVLEDAGRNVLLRRILSVPAFQKRFLETLAQVSSLLGGSGGWMTQQVEQMYVQIRTAVRDDPAYTCVRDGKLDVCTVADFEYSVGQLRDFARDRPAYLYHAILQAGWREDPTAPYLSPGAAGNAASQRPQLAPRELASVKVLLPVSAEPRPAAWPLPTELQGVSVQVSDRRMPIALVSSTEVWFQVPPDLLCGPSHLTVNSDGRASQTIPIEIRPANPGVLSVMHLDGRVVNASAPAQRGELVIAWSTGLGATYSDLDLEAPSGVDAEVEMGHPVSLYLNGKQAAVHWAGLVPGLLLQLVLFQVPGDATAGSASLVMSVTGEPGAPFILPVQ